MQILSDLSNTDNLKLIFYSMVLLNRVLIAISDENTFYGICDSIEEQGIKGVIQHFNKHRNYENYLHQQIVQEIEKFELMLFIVDVDLVEESTTNLR